MALLAELLTLARSWALCRVLTRRELAARHAGTAAGWLWGYAQPLLTIAAYYLVFDIVFAMRLGEHAPTQRVGAFLIVGALPWMAFGDAWNRGMQSLIEAGPMLHKNPLPPVLFPARSVLASALVFGPLMLLVAALYTPLHGGALALLALLPLALSQLLMVFLLAYLTAVLAAAVRDTVQVVGFLLSIGIFASPVLFPISQFPADWQWALWLNPMTAWVLGYQEVLLRGAWPMPSVWLALLLWPLGLAVVLNLVLKRSAEHLVDWL